jgi:hypothetical protein
MKGYVATAFSVSIKRLFAWLSLGIALAIFLGSFDHHVVQVARVNQFFSPFIVVAAMLLPVPFVYLWWRWK